MDIDAFIDALRRVASGGLVVDPEVVAELLGGTRAHQPLDRLSSREREVLCLMAEGKTNHAIAKRLTSPKRPSILTYATSSSSSTLRPAPMITDGCWPFSRIYAVGREPS